MSYYTCTSDESEKEEAFRFMLHNVCQRLNKSSLESVKYQCRDYIGRGKLEKVTNFSDLFTVLEERDIVSSDNVDFLISCLNCIPRKDLLKLVRQYANDWLSPEKDDTKQYSYDMYNGNEFSKTNKQCDTLESVGEASGKSNTKAIPFASEGFAYSPHANQNIVPQANNVQETLINFLVSHLTINWQITLRFIGVADDVIQTSQYNWPNDLTQQIFEALVQYTRLGGHLSRENVFEALRLSGRMDLIDILMSLAL